MHRPYIALSGSLPGENMVAINNHYLLSIWQAGGIPVLLSPTQDETYINEVCERFDGFLFCGGVDFDPKYYGEDAAPEIGEICAQRDEFEEKLFRIAYKTGKPIMGICRGMQGINVFLGGSLIQHMEGHMRKDKDHITTHSVTVAEGSPLNSIISSKEFLVNSYHHQAIKSLSNKLSADAYSTQDSFIEAIHDKKHNFLYGFQWHPELLYDTDEISRKIFKSFIDACNQV